MQIDLSRLSIEKIKQFQKTLANAIRTIQAKKKKTVLDYRRLTRLAIFRRKVVLYYEAKRKGRDPPCNIVEFYDF